MIIFRVTTGRTLKQLPSVQDGVITNHIEFEHPTAEETFLEASFMETYQGEETDLERDFEDIELSNLSDKGEILKVNRVEHEGESEAR